MKFKITLATGLILSVFFSDAQIDTAVVKNIWLKEIIIQPETKSNSRDLRPDKNNLTSTDVLLSNLPGISIIKRGSYAWEAGIRGLNAGQIQTTIDGMAIFGACTDRMDPVSSYLEPSNLKSIDLSYGINEETTGNSIGGGIRFNIKQPAFTSRQQIRGTAGTNYETNANAFSLFTSVNYSNERIAINVNGILRSAADYTAGNHQVIPFSQYNKWNSGVGIRYKVSEHSNLLLNYIHDEGHNIGYPALLMDILFARANIISLTHQKHFTSGIFQKMENKIYYNYINHAMDDSHRPASQVSMHMDMPGTSETVGFLSNLSAHTEKLQLSVHLSGYQNRLHASMTMYPQAGSPMYMLTLPDAQRRYAEAGLSGTFQPFKHLSLNAGGSLSVATSGIFSSEGKNTLAGTLGNHTGRTDLLTSVFFNPVINPQRRLSILLNTAISMRAPTLQELYGFYLFNRPDGYDYVGNPQLNKESSFNVSAGIRIRNPRYAASLKGYAYFIQQYIAGRVVSGIDKMTSIAKGVKQYTNLPSALLTGFEAEGSVKLTSRLFFISSNTLAYGRDNQRNALLFIPPFQSINRIEFTWKEIKISPEVVLSSAQNHVSESVYGETTTPGSLVYNFSAGMPFNLHSVKCFLQTAVNNIFNLNYFDHNNVMKIPEKGRNFLVRMKVEF